MEFTPKLLVLMLVDHVFSAFVNEVSIAIIATYLIQVSFVEVPIVLRVHYGILVLFLWC